MKISRGWVHFALVWRCSLTRLGWCSPSCKRHTIRTGGVRVSKNGNRNSDVPSQRSTATMQAPSAKGDYFRLPGIVHLVWVPMGLSLLAVSYYRPELAPNDYLGPIGSFNNMLIHKYPQVLAGIWYCAVALHIGEGVGAYILARKKNINDSTALKWGVQTLVYGVFSLKHLLAYNPKDKTE